MKRGLTILALTLGAASPAAAQLAGMPVWNNPKGGTGITISGDYGKPNDNAGGGNAFGARASLGLANLNITAGDPHPEQPRARRESTQRSREPALLPRW